MARKMTRWGLLGAAAAVMALAHADDARATPSSGFTASTLAKGQIGDIEVFNHLALDQPQAGHERHRRDVWLSWQKTKGDSDLYVQSNTWQPGATTGWHSHPGHSLIIVTAGTVTAYEGDDPDCKPHVYTTGMSFVDPGGDHVHVIRNESSDTPASTVAVQLIPAGATRRIDAADPGTCPF
jgi:quercetin dioxygenase-like cupin family protein